jgi:signal peptidase I
VLKAIAVASSGLFSPGFAHGLTSQRRAMAFWLALFALSLVPVAFTIWGLAVVVSVNIASVVHAVARIRQLPQPIHWNWQLPLTSVAVSVVLAFVARTYVIEAFKIPASSMCPTLQIGDHLFVSKISRLWHSPERGEVVVFVQPCMPDRDFVKRVIAVGDDTVEIRCNVVYVNGKAVANELVQADCTYSDFDQVNQKWFSRPCSRYHETLDGHGYDIFHDPDRPSRDARGTARAVGDEKDFPRDTTVRTCLNTNDWEPPAHLVQEPGTIVETKPESNPCEPHTHYVVPPGHLFVLGDNRSNSNDSRYWGSVPVENVKGTVVGIWHPLARFGALD